MGKYITGEEERREWREKCETTSWKLPITTNSQLPHDSIPIETAPQIQQQASELHGVGRLENLYSPHMVVQYKKIVMEQKNKRKKYGSLFDSGVSTQNLSNKCKKKLNSLAQCLTATRSTSHN